MTYISLNQEQNELINLPFDTTIFLEGVYGSGKTTACVQRLLFLLESGIPASQVLLMAPQSLVTEPYRKALTDPNVFARGRVTITTIGGLARSMIKLFYPLLTQELELLDRNQPLTFLNHESSQYYMAHLVRPLLDEGYFASLIMDKNRLYSQIIDTLHKAAVMGFPHNEIGERLASAWVGKKSQLRLYQDIQECADRFRNYCLAHNLLDFSLQIEIFRNSLYPHPLCQQYFLETYRHLIIENLEEIVPIAHDFAHSWLAVMDSALLIYDQEGGYRHFLGADAKGAYKLKEKCSHHLIFEQSFISPKSLQLYAQHLSKAIHRHPTVLKKEEKSHLALIIKPALEFSHTRFFTDMLDWTAHEVDKLVNEQDISPNEIVILSPYLSDALRFSLSEKLAQLGIPSRSHRPSRSLREEGVTQCLLTWAALVNPQLGIKPTKFALVNALSHTIEGIDLIRAHLLTDVLYHWRDDIFCLHSFEPLRPEVQERITYSIGIKYEKLRLWLMENQGENNETLDYFVSRLFGELLSQPGFRFHTDFLAAEITANLIDSIRNFRFSAADALFLENIPLAKEYCQMLTEGVLAAQYPRSWQKKANEEAVLITPAFTFLISNQPVQYQIWLDVGNPGWSDRPLQPLTHSYVLHRDWSIGRPWTDQDEDEMMRLQLSRLCMGLLRRCRDKVFISICEIGETGKEERGALLRALDRSFRESGIL